MTVAAESTASLIIARGVLMATGAGYLETLPMGETRERREYKK